MSGELFGIACFSIAADSYTLSRWSTMVALCENGDHSLSSAPVGCQLIYLEDDARATPSAILEHDNAFIPWRSVHDR